MHEEIVLKKINNVFRNSDTDIRVKSLSDIDNFLNNEKNTKLKVYEVVEQLYTLLMDDVML